jgi:hypothetical protein
VLAFQHTARHDSAALDPGRYRFELSHESHAAGCDIYVASEAERRAGQVAWSATCDGELEIASSFDRLEGLLIPERFVTARVRVTRDGTLVSDEVVPANRQCHGSLDTPGVPEPVEGPGALCLSFSTERWEASAKKADPDCERRFVGEPPQELRFVAGDAGQTFLGGGEYRLEVVGERYAAVCDVIVPTADRRDPDVEVRCEGDELRFLIGTGEILYLLLPARLRSVRVLCTRGSGVVFDGVVGGANTCEKGGAPGNPYGLCLYLAPDSTLADPASDAAE